MDYKKYFERIGLDESTPITKNRELLDKIQSHHVMAVPYENIDIVIEENVDDARLCEILPRHFGLCGL